jgi:hypothetical protein
MAMPIDDLSLPLWDLEPLSRRLRANGLVAIAAGDEGRAVLAQPSRRWMSDVEPQGWEAESAGGDPRAKVWIWPHRGARAATVRRGLWQRLRGGPGGG